MARSLGVRTVVVPPAPGLLSAVGLLEALPEYHFVQTHFAPVDGVDPVAVTEAYERMEGRAVRDLTHEGYPPDDIETRRAADLRYVGQAYELTVPCPSGQLDSDALHALADTFHGEHERTYGHRAGDEPVEIVNLRLTAMGTAGQVSPTRPGGSDAGPRREDRNAYFGVEHGLVTTPVIGRGDLHDAPQQGPFVVEEYDATTVVPPSCTARLDDAGNIVIEVHGAD
jgi:N-methylhydantoinase A